MGSDCKITLKAGWSPPQADSLPTHLANLVRFAKIGSAAEAAAAG